MNYRKYIEGEIDYVEFMRLDISLWKDVSIEKIREILDKIPLAEGAVETIQVLRTKGVKTAIVSSGISLLADRVCKELGADYVYSNKLVEDSDGRITCHKGLTVPLLGKLAVTMSILKQEKLQPSECAFIGDSLFDLPPYGIFGLSIGFNYHNEQSKNQADILLEGPDLRVLLPWLISGYPKKISICLPMNSKIANSLVAALSPDNIKLPQGLGIQVFVSNNAVVVRIVTVKGLETLLSTVNDVLSCTQIGIELVDVTASYRLAKTI